MTELYISKNEEYTNCDHDGCSGGERVTLIAQDESGKVLVEVSAGGCFGYNEDNLLTKFVREILKIHGIQD